MKIKQKFIDVLKDRPSSDNNDGRDHGRNNRINNQLNAFTKQQQKMK